MKSILYVGATLMIGASIYGFVDYKKTSQQKEFTRMYESSESKEPVTTDEKNVPATEIKKTNEVVMTTTKEPALKNAVIKTSITTEPIEKIAPETATIKTSSLKENNTEKKYKAARRKKLSYKLFSRAPLKEDLVIKDLKLEEPKKAEAVKTPVENKE